MPRMLPWSLKPLRSWSPYRATWEWQFLPAPAWRLGRTLRRAVPATQVFRIPQATSARRRPPPTWQPEQMQQLLPQPGLTRQRLTGRPGPTRWRLTGRLGLTWGRPTGWPGSTSALGRAPRSPATGPGPAGLPRPPQMTRSQGRPAAYRMRSPPRKPLRSAPPAGDPARSFREDSRGRSVRPSPRACPSGTPRGRSLRRTRMPL